MMCYALCMQPLSSCVQTLRGTWPRIAFIFVFACNLAEGCTSCVCYLCQVACILVKDCMHVSVCVRDPPNCMHALRATWPRMACTFRCTQSFGWKGSDSSKATTFLCTAGTARKLAGLFTFRSFATTRLAPLQRERAYRLYG